MNYKKKTLIISIFLIIVIQILLFVNNKQKSSFRYFIWNVQEISIGSLICISFVSGFIMSSILKITLNNKVPANYINGEEKKNGANDNFINEEGDNDSFEIPPQRDVRDPQPTISVNYRVIKNNGETELNDRNQNSTNTTYQDDWTNNDNEWE
tara:strand:- start:138 stop:596 length:459 start_codon:yes stop_codon:yes gene_type:complete